MNHNFVAVYFLDILVPLEPNELFVNFNLNDFSKLECVKINSRLCLEEYRII